ncbi:hypothetical protein [Streptomyces formicae]
MSRWRVAHAGPDPVGVAAYALVGAATYGALGRTAHNSRTVGDC